jgi:hypothetical protein
VRASTRTCLLALTVLVLVSVLAAGCRSPKEVDPRTRQILDEGKRLFASYLAQFLKEGQGRMRLQDFKVVKASMNAVQELPAGIMVRVHYSVLPADRSEHSSWRAGNGTLRRNGWIDKIAVIGMVEENGQWVIRGFGTGP